jgi:hypothetical protein
MVLRAKRDYQPIRSPLRPANSIPWVMQVRRRVTVAKMMAKNAAYVGYFVHVLFDCLHSSPFLIIAAIAKVP